MMNEQNGNVNKEKTSKSCKKDAPLFTLQSLYNLATENRIAQ